MKIIVVILLSFFPTSLRHGYDSISAGKKMKISFKKIDTSRIAVFQYDKADTFHFKKGDRPASLSAKEINKIELLIDSAVAEKHKKDGKYFSIGDPSKYYKQLIAVINTHGDKIVWANCLCSVKGDPDWKKNVLGTLDGGVCYFNLKINLSKNITFDFYVNNYE